MDLTRYFNDNKVRMAKQEATDLKSRETLVYISPRDFLKLAPDIGHVDEMTTEELIKVVKSGTKFADVPYLRTVANDGEHFKIDGHEGRHRSLTFVQLNMRGLMPVRIIDRDTRWLEDGYYKKKITLIAQEGSYSVEVTIGGK